jgi:NitT/TauT family transport system ATP-binding protein
MTNPPDDTTRQPDTPATASAPAPASPATASAPAPAAPPASAPELPPARSAGDVVVRIAGADKRFTAGSVTTVALQGIDLDIRRGEFVSLIGPSGCGKSTLLRLIGDLTPPSAGTVTVNGKPAAQARRDRDYGMVFQAPVLFDWRTVEDNVKLPLEILGYDKARKDARAREMLELVELTGFLRHHPYQLSGGMQQRVAIARALAFEPAILLMDEPFGALDEMTRERMNQEVLRIWERTGITIVFVTHSIPEAVFLSSRVVVMSARPGRITDVIDVDLPRPRGVETRELPRYFELVTAVREALRRGEPSGAAVAGTPGPDAGSRPQTSADRIAAEGVG